jgi:hypothetical protein
MNSAQRSKRSTDSFNRRRRRREVQALIDGSEYPEQAQLFLSAFPGSARRDRSASLARIIAGPSGFLILIPRRDG